VFAFALNPEIKNYNVFDVSDKLRERGWLVPAYTFPENRTDLSVLRVVVRAGMNVEMADKLLEHLSGLTNELQALPGPLPRPAFPKRKAFAH
jgi:glutamate decarboxylase